MEQKSWLGNYIAEAFGDFILIFFGCGIIFVAILFGGVGDLFSAGMAWGLAVMLAVYTTASISGTHINPSVTLALAFRRQFPWSQVVPYIISQIVGAFLGALALYLMFGDAMYAFAAKQGITIGGPGSEKIAMMFVPYVPHPWIVGTGPEAYAQVPIWRGMLTEFLATALLVIFVLTLLEGRSINAPQPWFFPFALGLGVCMLVFVTAPLTMTSLNAARDLGPRILTALIGFGSVAFPGPRGGLDLLTTTVVPALGGIAGAYFFDFVLRPFYPKQAQA
jgi:glycerol uptake facilitator protein